jgi:hypothetical protein
MSTFKFFKGIVSARVVSVGGYFNRLPRTPINQIPVPATLNTLHSINIFREGWRACEQDRNIYDCPYSSYDPTQEESLRNWEWGFTECFNRRRTQTDDYIHQMGYESAQNGLPINQNPYTYGSNEFNMWYIGWNDFVDNH